MIGAESKTPRVYLADAHWGRDKLSKGHGWRMASGTASRP